MGHIIPARRLLLQALCVAGTLGCYGEQLLIFSNIIPGSPTIYFALSLLHPPSHMLQGFPPGLPVERAFTITRVIMNMQ